MSNYQIKLKAIDNTTANERSKPILDDVIKKNGAVPNMYANMVNSPGLLETYLHGYDVFRKESGFTPVEQEVVFLTLSYENACDYCMAAHSVIADKMSKVPADVTNAIREGQAITDDKLQALSLFTKEMFTTRGRPSAEAAAQFLEAGYTERQVLEIIIGARCKNIEQLQQPRVWNRTRSHV